MALVEKEGAKTALTTIIGSRGVIEGWRFGGSTGKKQRKKVKLRRTEGKGVRR